MVPEPEHSEGLKSIEKYLPKSNESMKEALKEMGGKGK